MLKQRGKQHDRGVSHLDEDGNNERVQRDAEKVHHSGSIFLGDDHGAEGPVAGKEDTTGNLEQTERCKHNRLVLNKHHDKQIGHHRRSVDVPWDLDKLDALAERIAKQRATECAADHEHCKNCAVPTSRQS